MFSLDFAASAPLSYDHLVGGGAFDDRTIGRDKDVVESLQGGDFKCFDLVSYLTEIRVDSGTTAVNQTIELDYEFLADTTGQSGVAHVDIVNVGVNDGTALPFADLISGENGKDDAIVDTGTDAAASLGAESFTKPPFTQSAKLQGTVVVSGLDAGDVIVVRIDVELGCKIPSSPTGNLQADITDARVTQVGGEDVEADTISVGNQTIPFKNIGDVLLPGINVTKDVSVDGGLSFVAADTAEDAPTASNGSPVQFKFTVTNEGNAPLTNLALTDSIFTLTQAPTNCTVPTSSAVGASYSCIITRTLSAPPELHTNTATASGQYGTETVTDTNRRPHRRRDLVAARRRGRHPIALAWTRSRQRLEAEARLRYLETHDPLTGLSNRKAFDDLLSNAMATMQQNRTHIAVLCLDVDKFHEITIRLTLPPEMPCCARSATASVGAAHRRLRGAAFERRIAVAIVDIDNLGEVVSSMDRLAEALRLPIRIADKEFMCTLSAGIALAPNDGDTAPELLRHADIALARAKAEGGQRMRFFEESMDKALQRRHTVAQDLRLALRREEFEVVYQSEFDLATGEQTGVKPWSTGIIRCMARWRLPTSSLGGGGNRLDRAARRMGAPPRLQRRRHLEQASDCGGQSFAGAISRRRRGRDRRPCVARDRASARATGA